MNTELTAKISALAVALVLNSLIMVGVAYLFDGESQQQSSVIALAGTTVQPTHEAT
jgi:hypothetical protein